LLAQPIHAALVQHIAYRRTVTFSVDHAGIAQDFDMLRESRLRTRDIVGQLKLDLITKSTRVFVYIAHDLEAHRVPECFEDEIEALIVMLAARCRHRRPPHVPLTVPAWRAICQDLSFES
jgi:hypothetical protein